MEILGQPQRSATQDANAGIVEPSHEKKMGRSTAVKQKKASPLDSAVSNFGEAFGNVIQQFTEEAAGNRAEQKALDGHLRQGTDTAINEIARDKKRGVVMSGIFGQDIEYRAAQQRATENVVRDKFNEQMTVIDQFAGEAPDRYQIRLKDQLNDMLEPYGQDQDTKNLVTNAWMQASEKLSKEQFKGHYAYNQQQQRETTEQMVKGIHDSHTLVAMKATSPEEQTDIFNIAKEMYSDKSKVKPNGMSNEAWRGVLTGQINEQMEAGNIGATNIARMSGFLDSYLPVEQANFDKARKEYDRKAVNDMGQALDRWEIDVLRLNSIEEVDDYIDAAQREAEAATLRKSGTEKYDRMVSDAVLRLEKMRKKAHDSASGRKAEEDRRRELWWLKTQDATTHGGKIVKPQIWSDEENKLVDAKLFSKKEHNNSQDYGMRLNVAQSMGMDVEDLSPDEVMKSVFENPAYGAEAAHWYKSTKWDTPLVEKGIAHLVSSVEAGHFEGEDSRFSPEAVTAISGAAQFDGPKLAKSLGKDLYGRYKTIQESVLANRTVKRYLEDVEAQETAPAGKSGVSRWGTQVNDGKVETDRAYVKRIAQKKLGQNITESQTSDYFETFNKAMQRYGQDKQKAWNFMDDLFDGQKTDINGQQMNGEIDKDWDFSFQDNWDGLEKNNALAPYFFLGTGKLDTPVTSAKEVTGVTFKTDPNVNGVIMDAPNWRQPVVVPTALFEEQDKKNVQDREFDLMRKAAREKSKVRSMGTDTLKAL